MKVLPVIICGGAGTRLFKESKDNLPKQFIDFGGWTMFQKTLDRVNSKLFLPPIISTNVKYLNLVKKHLKKNKITNYKIVLEPSKKNTAPAILSPCLLPEIASNQIILFLPSEAVYAELHANFSKLVREGFQSRVWIVSPTTLMATLNTMRAILSS